jgi:DNA-binding response OmpR family regulator
MLRFRAWSRTTPTILLVEDLESLRIPLQAILKQAGLRVLLANDSGEALRIARTCSGSIDLLLTHLRLAETWGPDLAARLRACRPRMAALYMSKSLAEMMELSDAADFISALLPQPFGREILLRRVNLMLASHA